MSAANLAKSVLNAPAFAMASAGELGDAALTASDIGATARKIAADLRGAGAIASEPIVLFVSNMPQDIVAFMGIWLAGCVAAPIHVATPAPAVESLIARLGARLAIRAGALERLAATPPPVRPLLDGAALIVWMAPRLSSLRPEAPASPRASSSHTRVSLGNSARSRASSRRRRAMSWSCRCNSPSFSASGSAC